MKSQIKKGHKKGKEKEKPQENYRVRFRKLMSYIFTWRHYIVMYFKEREQRFYEKLYKVSNKGRRPKPVELSSQNHATISENDLTESLEKGPFPQKESMRTIPVEEDNFHKINISFFMEEFFLYILDSVHSTAALAYVFAQFRQHEQTRRLQVLR